MRVRIASDASVRSCIFPQWQSEVIEMIEIVDF
jgi:hypothetical protein